MNYYSHHIGDFNNATRHLTRIERSIYRDLMDLYYDREAPVPTDVERVCKLILATAPDEVAAVQSVLDEFFVLQDDGWHNSRCDDEIAAYRAKHEQASRAGKASAERRKQAKSEENTTDAQRTLDGCSTDVQPTNNQEPVTKNQKPRGDIYPTDFEAIWSAYPTRPGSSKQGAYRAWKSRIKAGVRNDDMLDGVRRYAAFVRESGTQPQYVKHAATFLGPDEHYRSDWTVTRGAPARQTIHDERKATLDALTGRSTSNGQFDIIDV